MHQSVVSMTSDSNGRPQVYEETMSTTTAPGGIKETKQTVRDTRTGTQRMAIGRYIGDRSHTIEKEQNVESGEQEERHEYENIEEGIIILKDIIISTTSQTLFLQIYCLLIYYRRRTPI